MRSRIILLLVLAAFIMPYGYAEAVSSPVLGAKAVSNSQINLAWTDNNNARTTYRIYRGGLFIYQTPKGVHSYNNGGLAAGTTYTYQVVAVAKNGTAASNTATATTFSADATPPAVSISSPASGTSYSTAQTVTITASASDTAGVAKVEFYDGATLMATSTGSPYACTWQIGSADNGTHSWTARAYDAAGNTATSNAVDLTVNIAAVVTSSIDAVTDAISTGSTHNRKVARTSDGAYHIVYTKTVNGYSQIFYAVSPDGVSWTTTQLTSAGYNQYLPSLAVDSSDNVHIVWQGFTSGSPSKMQIRYMRYSGTWSGITEITSDALYQQAHPAIAVGASDVVYVVWNGTSASSPANAQIRYVGYSGGWSAVTDLTTDASYDQQEASIAIDSTGNIHLAWYGYSSFSPSHHQIRYIKYSNGSWSGITELTTDPSYEQTDTTMAIDSADNIHLAWIGNDTASPSVYQVRYMEYGGSWSSITDLTSDTSNSSYMPNISVDSLNDVFVVFSYNVGPDIQLGYLSNDGSGWSSISFLSDANSTSYYPSAMSSLYPVISGKRWNIKESGMQFIWEDHSASALIYLDLSE